MPTFHTLDEALKKFNEKFYSIPDKTCLWHRNVDLRQFLSLVWQSAQEARNRELVEALKQMPLARPELESDEYDAGLKDARENALRIVSLINK